MTSHGLSSAQLQILRKILMPFAQHIECVGLFGSRATGCYRSNSDIDIVIYGNIDEKTIDHLFTVLNDSSLPFKIDLQAYNNIVYPPLRDHIDAVMQPLFSQQELLDTK